MSAPEDHYTPEEIAQRAAPRPLTSNEQVDCLALGLFAQRIGKSDAGRVFLGAFCLALVRTMGRKILTGEQLVEMRAYITRAIGEPL